MKTAKKETLINEIYEHVGGTKKEISDVINAAFETIKEKLEEGETIRISGFGSFEVSDTGERPGRNPKTREELVIPSRRVVRYKISKVFKKKLNEEADF